MPPRPRLRPPSSATRGVAQQLRPRLRQLVSDRTAALEQRALRVAEQAERWMRATARWRDRTGTARRELRVRVYRTTNGRRTTFELGFVHGAAHGIWLETHRGPAYGRRAGMARSRLGRREYAGPLSVLWPAADRWGPVLRRQVPEVFR